MRPDDVFEKTEKGHEEIKTRSYKLQPPLRTLLVMIDGRTKAEVLLKQTKLLGATPDLIDQLAAQGFIAALPAAAAPSLAPSPAARPGGGQRLSDAKQFMNETAVNAGGLRSFTFTLKLEKSESLADLHSLLPEYARLIQRGTGTLEAEVLVKRVQELLA